MASSGKSGGWLVWLRVVAAFGLAGLLVGTTHSVWPLVLLLEVLLFFNLLIVVHELGHFLAARWRGMVVTKFGIWFGKPIWKKRINGVEYSLGTIPAGGFVSLPQMASMETVEGPGDLTRDEVPPARPLDKIIVALAGPVFSFGLAVVFATIVWIVGRPVSEAEGTTVVGWVEKDGPAGKAGLLPGDRIVRVDGRPVTRFGGMGNDSITWRVVRSEGATIPIDVLRPPSDQKLRFEIEPKREKRGLLQRQSLREIQAEPAVTPEVDRVLPNSPAALAGIKPGDRVLSVDGERIYSPSVLVEYIAAHPGAALQLQISRPGQSLSITVTPRVPVGGGDPKIGIGWDASGSGTIHLIHPTPWEQIKQSIVPMVNTVSALFSPKSDIKPQHMSGPVGIMNVMYRILESHHAWRLILWFGVLININLALLNLLPIPILDGGHVLLSLIEWARRRPLNVRFLEVIQTGCAALVMGYIAYVTFFDVQDLPLPWKKAAPASSAPVPAETQFAPPSPQ